MSLTLTNTLTGDREPFEPIDPETVTLYYCGLTVSDDAHLGHARSWVHVDVMHRWLGRLGYRVNHVENFTDVNEKIVARVGSIGPDESSVARHYIDRIIADMRSLNLVRASVYPRVSEHIPEIIDLIDRLINAGYAYESNGSVYFDVTTFESYGSLSNQRVDEIEAQDVETIADKRHPADFALWKAGGVDPTALAEHWNGELPADPPTGQTWPSPWGAGRPGWHIECSAMSMSHLGESIDIHVGGQDLVFPHHENEIAQSEAATGRSFAKYWLHVRLLETGGEKMSSSLENYFTVSNAVAELGGNVVRTFLLSTAYLNTQTYSESTLAEARERWERLDRSYGRAVAALDSPDARTKIVDEELRDAVDRAEDGFRTGMNDDFNTRKALAALSELANAVNRHIDNRDEYDYRGLRSAVERFEVDGGDVLGLELGDGGGRNRELVDGLIGLLLDIRADARAAGEYDRADELRDALNDLGVEVQDTESGASYRLS